MIDKERNILITKKINDNMIPLRFACDPVEPGQISWILNDFNEIVAKGSCQGYRHPDAPFGFIIDDESLQDIAEKICSVFPDIEFTRWYKALYPQEIGCFANEPMPPAWENIFLTLLHNSTKDRTILNKKNADVLISSTDEIYSALKEKWRL